MFNIEDKAGGVVVLEWITLSCVSTLNNMVKNNSQVQLWWTVSVFHSIQHICLRHFYNSSLLLSSQLALPLWAVFTFSSHFQIPAITHIRGCSETCFQNNIWGPSSPPPHLQACASRALGISVWSSSLGKKTQGFFQSNYHFLTQEELQGLPCGTSPTSHDMSLAQRREHRVHSSEVIRGTETLPWQHALQHGSFVLVLMVNVHK